MWERIGNCFNVPQGRRIRVKEFGEEKEILFLVRYLVLTSAAAIHFLPFFPRHRRSEAHISRLLSGRRMSTLPRRPNVQPKGGVAPKKHLEIPSPPFPVWSQAKMGEISELLWFSVRRSFCKVAVDSATQKEERSKTWVKEVGEKEGKRRGAGSGHQIFMPRKEPTFGNERFFCMQKARPELQ